MQNKRYKIYSAIIFSLLFFNCMSVPMIQSPRVISKFSITSSGIYSPTEFQVKTNDSLYRDRQFTFNPYDMREFPQGFNAMPECHFGIARRVEISGYLTPPIGEYVINASLSAKVALFDIGSYRLFKNCAVAIFGGGKMMNGEWDGIEFINGGFIAGTRTSVGRGELELIWMESGYYNRLSSSPGEAPGVRLKEKGLDNSIGVAYWPFSNRLLHINAGLTVRTPFKRSVKSTGIEAASYLSSDISPFIFQGSLCLDIARY
ncbi:MAG TPA: hypothetical protein VHO70_00700 [Chitinispirillaceae bacterium]|nr:hypothetical protein [Chitinispirillaceae bacterium]